MEGLHRVIIMKYRTSGTKFGLLSKGISDNMSKGTSGLVDV